MLNQPVLCPVLPEHRFDEKALQGYLKNKLPGAEQSIKIKQFQGGQSNPTFLLETPAGCYVLRKKPPGKLLPSAHKIEREFQVMDALQATPVPVPKTRLLCEDAEVIGTAFYIMDHVPGRVVEKPDLPGLQPDERQSVYQAMATTLANLHRVDWQAVGLENFGKPENYYTRQINRWTQQYLASCDPPAGGEAGARAMRELIDWLPVNIPDDDRVTLAHGDYRVGNLILDTTEPHIKALLDWELSTLGHPLADLAYCCIPYHLPWNQGGIKGLLGLDLQAAGIPSEKAFITSYCEQAGLPAPTSWNFYLAFALFRLAAILQGVYARALQGNASSANALDVGGRAALLAETAWKLARQG